MPGWEAFWYALTGGRLLETLSALTNVLMVLALVRSRGARAPRRLGHLTWLLFGSAAYNLSLWTVLIARHRQSWADSLGIGFWAWTASFICVAAGLRMRAKGRASAEPAASMAATR